MKIERTSLVLLVERTRAVSIREIVVRIRRMYEIRSRLSSFCEKTVYVFNMKLTAGLLELGEKIRGLE